MPATNGTGRHTPDQQLLDLQTLWQGGDSGQVLTAAAAVAAVADGPLAHLQALWDQPDGAATQPPAVANAGPANVLSPADATAALIAKLRGGRGNN